MGITYSSVVDAPIGEVFEWHARPGAITRLSPPWQPVRVGQEAGSLRDGRAVLLLPGGVRWVADHQPDGYNPPHQFVDQLVSAGLSSVLSWRHTHMFSAEGEAEGENETRVTDDVQTPVPAAALRQMFAYRHRQLAADLTTLRWARLYRNEPLTVAVTGSSGLVGTALTALLSTGGHRVIKLVRRPAAGAGERQWQPGQPAPDLLAGVDAVVHLAGAGIAGRFTPAHKRAVRDSRIGPTRRLAELAAALRRRHPAGRRVRRPIVARPTAPGRSSLPPRSAITAPTAATRSWARTARRAMTSWPVWSRTGKRPPRPPRKRACGSCRCAPGSCSPRRAASCGCSSRCSRPGSVAASARGGSGCPGSASTTWPISTCVLSSIRRCPGR